MSEEQAKWQPVMLVKSGGRLECECGALAIFVCLDENEDGDGVDYTAWCQECFSKAQEEETRE